MVSLLYEFWCIGIQSLCFYKWLQILHWSKQILVVHIPNQSLFITVNHWLHFLAYTENLHQYSYQRRTIHKLLFLAKLVNGTMLCYLQTHFYPILGSTLERVLTINWYMYTCLPLGCIFRNWYIDRWVFIEDIMSKFNNLGVFW